MPRMDTLTTAPPRHFLDLDRIDGDTLRRILDQGAAYKRGGTQAASARPLAASARGTRIHAFMARSLRRPSRPGGHLRR